MTRGLNSVQKELFTGTKKACIFNHIPLQTSLQDISTASLRDNEYVFDKREDFYSLTDLANLYRSTTNAPGNLDSSADACAINTIIYQVESSNA